MKFANPETKPFELLDDETFPNDCFDFGFKMDCGEAFIERYSDGAFREVKELQKIVAEIDDIDLLGSAVFSQWRYFNHWAYSPDEINEPNVRAWFVCALSRLMALTQPEPAKELNLKKIALISNCICYRPEPNSEEEIEQHLTICSDGRVYLSRYAYGNGFGKYKLIEKQTLKITENVADYILKEIAEYYVSGNKKALATDVGLWELTMTDENGYEEKDTGSLIPTGGRLQDVSDAIRYYLNMLDLLCFDGRANQDRIENIKIEYNRCTKIKPKVVPDGATWEYVTWDYSESIEIDRRTEIISHIQNIAQECSVKREYHVGEGVGSFLDEFDADDLFVSIEGNPPDAIHDPLETKTYSITVSFMNGEPRVLSGSFDKHGLPEDFRDFAESLYGFMRFYGDGEMLNPTVFEKTLRKQDDLIFCNVQFGKYGKTYCYLTKDEGIQAGDMVVVPVGSDNRESVASVESIEYHTAEEAPFPIEKIKSVIRKCGDESPEQADEKSDIEESALQWEQICRMVDNGENLTPELKELFMREPEKKEQYKWKLFDAQ